MFIELKKVYIIARHWILMEEVGNVLRILIDTRKAIDSKDSFRIKQLSDQTIHSATIYQDPDNIIVAVLVYSLSKIVERDHLRTLPGWEDFYHGTLRNLDECIKAIKQGDLESFRKYEKFIRVSIEKIDGKLQEYIRDVFKKSQINKASKIYEHGLSLEKTSELLGVSIWELSQYVGQSNAGEISETLPVSKRIKIAEEIFS
jgi:predicted transcriptional regulator